MFTSSDVVLSWCVSEDGFIQKAVNYGGEMFVIEGIQVYEDPQPISTLRLSSAQVPAAGTSYGAARVDTDRTSLQVDDGHMVCSIMDEVDKVKALLK